MIKRLLVSPDGSAPVGLALLVLRVWLGLTIALNHGLMKLQKFDSMKEGFLDFFGLGPTVSLVLAVFGEFVCGLLLVIGLISRFAALSLAITMAVAFFMMHKGALTGPQSGELAFIYLAGFVALLLAGPGRFSVDAAIQGKSKSGKGAASERRK